MATLSRGEHPNPCLDRLLLHITLRIILIFMRLQKTKERVLLITKRGRLCANVKRKVVKLVTLVLGRFSIDFRKLL